ncbi:GTP-binding protein [Modicisalibacter luteus]
MCCQLAFVLQAGLVNLLHRSRPDRLLIEPSGLGHPAGLLDVLRSDSFKGALTLSEVIVLLDPRRMHDDRALQHETFRDQLALADGVVLSMTDIASQQQIQAAQDYVGGLWPAKRWLRNGRFMTIEQFLQPGAHWQDEVKRPEAHRLKGTGQVLMLDAYDYRQPKPGKPVHDEGESLGFASHGWRWHPDDVFDLDRLTRGIDDLPGDIRLKGIWHTTVGWKSLNRSQGYLALEDVAWRRDSRVELIGQRLPEADALESMWQQCRIAGPC